METEFEPGAEDRRGENYKIVFPARWCCIGVSMNVRNIECGKPATEQPSNAADYTKRQLGRVFFFSSIFIFGLGFVGSSHGRRQTERFALLLGARKRPMLPDKCECATHSENRFEYFVYFQIVR